MSRLLIPALIITSVSVHASPGLAQTRATSLDDLRRELATGDLVTVVPAAGQPVRGRLTRLGTVDLDVRPVDKGTSPIRGAQDVTIPLDAIQTLERPRDSSRNGAAIGAGVGAGFGGALFVHALVVDRNEIEEWAPLYAGVAAASIGIGALLGWALDAANSKPGISFHASAAGRPKVSVQPAYSPGRGIALAVSFKLGR